MDFKRKMKTAEAYAQISEATLAKRVEMSPQSFCNRLKTGKFSMDELEQIGEALGAKFVCYFEFPDGQKI